MSAQTHSSWIVKLIKRAYSQNQKHIGTVKGHSTRSVGPSWALFKGAGMKAILEGADWSQPNKFVKFYLKDVQIDFLKI